MILTKYKEGGRGRGHTQPGHLQCIFLGNLSQERFSPFLAGTSLGNQRLCVAKCGNV